LGVDASGVGDDQRERETLAGFCPRATLSPRLQTVNDKRKRVLVISRIQRRYYQASFLLLVGFAKEE
jgi:hypothetical protein